MEIPLDETLFGNGGDNLVPGQDPGAEDRICLSPPQNQLKEWWRGNSNIVDHVVAHEPPLFRLPPERIKVTTVHSFWTVVKHAAIGDGLLAAFDNIDPASGLEGGPANGRLAANLQNTVVMMPRFFLQVCLPPSQCIHVTAPHVEKTPTLA